jgi:hypothetical protein
LSERPLTTKGENRRDLPLGVGTSVSLHVVAAICIFFAAAAFIVSGQPAFSPQNAHDVIIQTLTRTPHIATQLHRITQPIHPEKPLRIGVSQPTHARRMVEHAHGAIAAQAAPLGFASAAASAARHHAVEAARSGGNQPQIASGSSASASNVSASANGTAASGVSGAGGSGPGGSGDSTPQTGGGSVWTDKPASGGTLGDKIPDATRPYCTPGRGGFLNRR